jgi:TonB family protein
MSRSAGRVLRGGRATGDMDENGGLSEHMPQTIGRYQVQESVGYGAMGAVYKAFDPLIKRTLAIKTIRLDIPRQSPQYKSFIDRFYHEARISGTLSHPNIVTLFDIGEENGLPYLAMEFVEGETLSSLLEKGLRFKPEKVIGLVSQVAAAVDYAHSKGVIHRDIKPSNLILSEGDRIKVTDFGIAKLIDAEMTQSGTLLGTPSYMSPEQAMGEKLDGRSDIFSLGVCAFEMLSGEQPFPGNNVTSILYKLVHVEPIEPANLEMHGLVPQKWHEVFGKVLAKRPDDRYQTATEFVQDLEYCLGAWFGAAMSDATIAEPVPLEPPPELDPIEQTVSMSAPHIPDPPAPGWVQAPPPEIEPTLRMPAPTAADIEGTVVMTAPVMPPAPPAAAPPPAPAPAAVPVEEGTVLMAVPHFVTAASPAATPGEAETPPPAPAAPPKAEMEGTVLMSVPAAILSASAPPPAPTHPASGPNGDDIEGTVMMAAPGARPRPPVADGTVLMSAPVLPPTPPPPPAKKDMDGTVLMSAPVPPRPAPIAEHEVGVKPPPRPPVARADGGAQPASQKRGAPILLIVGGLGVLFLVAVAVVVLVWLQQRRTASGSPAATPQPTTTVITEPPAPATPPPPPTLQGTVNVQSEPAGATVTVDGETLGVTPLDVTEKGMGRHEVRVELKGYAPATQTVELTAEAPHARIALTLTRAAVPQGSVDITSVPSGALVRVDGISLGQTPVRDHRLRAGSHSVEITADGYEKWTGSLQVRDGRKTPLVVPPLRAIPRATPTPADVADPNRIYAPNEVDVPANRLSYVSASWPDKLPRPKARQSLNVTGTFVVNERGEVGDIRIVESGGAPVDDAVKAAVAKWKYSPAEKKGTKVKVRLTFKQTFLGYH